MTAHDADAQDTDHRRAHWDRVYRDKADDTVSWFQARPRLSLDLIGAHAVPAAAVIDIGGGASRLVDALLLEGYTDVTVLDLAASALEASIARLGPRSSRVHWITADITTWTPTRTYGVLHDRAVFHFLTEAADRAAYRRALDQGTRPGSLVVIATFAEDGPERCSGLPVRRYSPDSLAAELGPGYQLLGSAEEAHETPGGAVQAFQFSQFRRAG